MIITICYLKDFGDLALTLLVDSEMTGFVKGKAEGKAEGLAEGKAEGKAEGLAEGLEMVAINMLKLHKSIDEIILLTGLSRQVITQLQAKMGI